jgi:homoserine O-acetyltransferase/O-succinyltransferase
MVADECCVSTFVFQFGNRFQRDGTHPGFCTIFELNNKAKLRAAGLTNKSAATSPSPNVVRHSKSPRMKAKFFLLQVLVLFIGLENVQAQSTTDTKQQYMSLGDFNLENGQKILDCKIGYRTFGKPNADRSNTIIFLCGFTMNTALLQSFVPGMVVDTTKFYLILIDALGNGYSSSPSNSVKQPRLQFPQFTIRDMVESQYKMLTEKMSIHHLAAVAGISMGGFQTLQWAVSHPDFMDKALPVEATPQFTSYDLLWSNTFLQAIKSDSAYHNGNYKGEPALPVASQIVQMIFSTPEYVTNHVSRDSFYTWYVVGQKQVTIDWNNQVRQMEAIIKHDITKTTNGSLEEAAKTIKAKTLIIVVKQDHTVNPILSKKFASMMNAQFMEIDSEGGHTTHEIPFGAMHEFFGN